MVWKKEENMDWCLCLTSCIHFLEILTDKLFKSSQLYKDFFPFYKRKKNAYAATNYKLFAVI